MIPIADHPHATAASPSVDCSTSSARLGACARPAHGSTRHFGRLVAPNLKRVCRMVGYTATCGDEVAMWHLAATINARLGPRERVFLATSTLWALTDEEYAALIKFMESSHD